jgi:hypothetical protein
MIRVAEDDNLRRHLETAPMLTPQRTYLSTTTPARNSRPAPLRATPQQPVGGVPRTTTAEPGRPWPARQGVSPEAHRLRDRVLELVYGDKRLARRLLAFAVHVGGELRGSDRAAHS